MSVTRAVGTASQLITVAADLAAVGAATGRVSSEAAGAVTNVANFAQDKANTANYWAARAESSGRSLASATSQFNIMARMFVDESIVDEVVMPNLSRSFFEWYAAQIFKSLHLNRMVEGGEKVQDILNRINTGDTQRFTNSGLNILHRLANAEGISAARSGNGAMPQSPSFGGLESFVSNLEGCSEDSFGQEAYNFFNKGNAPRPGALTTDDMARNRVTPNPTKAASKSDTPREISMRNVEMIDMSKKGIGPVGEIINIEMGSGGKDGTKVTIPLYVQILPMGIPVAAAPRFIDREVSPSMWQRWTQMTTGEIRFWKDFIFQADLIEKNTTPFKDPKTANVWKHWLNTIAKKDQYARQEITSTSDVSTFSKNLPNSIVVFSENTVAEAKADSGIDLHDPSDRERYFKSTYTMIIAIIDPIHQMVTIYYSGIDGAYEGSYDAFKPNKKGFDPADFVQALRSLSNGVAPRPR